MKRAIGFFLVATLFLMLLLCIPASAETATISARGFYNIGTAEGVTITPKASSGSVTKVTADVDGDSNADTFYANSDMMTVTYTGASASAHYGVIMVEGNELPNKDNEIFYIDQITAVNNAVTFNVYPLLPTTKSELTLYISSSEDDFDLIKIPLNYVPNASYDAPAFTLGMVNDDSIVDAADALLTLEIAAKLYTPTDTQEKAANVNGDAVVDAADALRILEYAAKLITSWE